MNKKLKELKIERDLIRGVGKKMGYHIWLHKDYVEDAIKLEEYLKYKKQVPSDFNFDILRIDSKTNEIAFISSPDFNVANEPIVGDMYKVKKIDDKFELSSIVKSQKDPLIYHHKWTFVKDDFKGFNVEESKQRTIDWKSILGVNKEVSMRIGRLSFWDNWLKENNIMERVTKKQPEENLPEMWKIYNEISLESRLESEKNNVDNPVVFKLSDGSDVEQKIPSANTARLQRPKTIQIIKECSLYKNSPVLLDVGCGSGNAYFKDDMKALGVDYNGCDLYNQEKETNLSAIRKCMNGGADIVTLNNVLNTIEEKEVRKSVLEQCKNGLNPETGMLLILTYEGEKNASEKKWELENNETIKKLTPIKTRDGWQNRMPTLEYLSEIEQVFPNVKLITIGGSKIIVAAISPDIDLDLKKRIVQKKKYKF